MEHFMMCRSAYCPKCADERRPNVGNLFVLYQGTKQQIITGKVERTTIWGDRIESGYTPHLFSLIKAQDKTVHYMKNCLMNHCGVRIKQNVDKSTGEIFIDFEFVDTQHDTMSVEDWNALVSRWHGYTGYEL